jgi:hypothetical protein
MPSANKKLIHFLNDEDNVAAHSRELEIGLTPNVAGFSKLIMMPHVSSKQPPQAAIAVGSTKVPSTPEWFLDFPPQL